MMFLGIKAPVLMIVAATLVKCLQIMPAKMEQGLFHLYKFVSTSLSRNRGHSDLISFQQNVVNAICSSSNKAWWCCYSNNGNAFNETI